MHSVAQAPSVFNLALQSVAPFKFFWIEAHSLDSAIELNASLVIDQRHFFMLVISGRLLDLSLVASVAYRCGWLRLNSLV